MEQMSFFSEYPIVDDMGNTAHVAGNKHRVCLWNGEYGEHDLSHINGLEGIERNQANIYPQYIGVTIGDFTCVDVEYDWGKRDQRWKVRCNLCGEESYRYHTGDWRRGKGGKTYCHCRKDAEKREIEEKKAARELAIAEETGKLYGTFEVIEYKGYDACKVRCVKCGAIRKKGVTIGKLKQGIFPECDCGKPKYSDPKWIGMRVGHLVVETYAERYFVCKCDCGRERVVNTTYFARKRYLNCGSSACEYISEAKAAALKARSRGETYEVLARAIIESGGYEAKIVGKTADFGVDIIAKDSDGKKIAVQCKSNMKSLTGVAAVQQVYAGGRYFGLKHFAVISHSGYSVNAVKMARKLGVYLSDGQSFRYPDELGKYADELIPTVKVQKHIKAQKLYNLNGQEKTLANIAFENGTTEYKIRDGLKKGLTIENAVEYAKQSERKNASKTYTVDGVTGTIAQLCDHFRVVSPECAAYRIRHGVSIEDAILTKKMQTGRPRKEPKPFMEYGQTTLAI